ncbi:MAG: phosphatidate cytidylyltransferase [Coprobacillus sp.]|nr:phosphatidate cytidylyltransferase [Coprobacillus sp.]
MPRDEILEHNQLTKDQKHGTFIRTISAIVIIIIALPCILVGDWFYFALCLIGGGIATYELIRCVKHKYSPAIYVVSIIIMAALIIWPIFKNLYEGEASGPAYYLYNDYNSLSLSVILMVAGLLLLLLLVVIDPNFSVRDACLIFAFLVLIAIGIQCALILRFYPQYIYHLENGASDTYFNFYDSFESCSLAVCIIAGTYMNDTGAFFTGMLFGKSKLNERISPKKTWEGFIGGICFSFLFVFLFGFILALCNHPMLGIFDVDHWYLILILAFLIPLFGTFGDFIFSSAKRNYGIKDYGNLIPGHGGILDRVDSLIVTALVSALYVLICSALILGVGSPLF